MTEHQIFVTVNGVSKTPHEWSDFLGISIASFYMRLQDGRNVDDQLFGRTKVAVEPVPVSSEPVERIGRKGRKASLLTLKGESKTLKEWCEVIGISMTSLRYRLDKGYTEEQILLPRQATNSKKLPIEAGKEKTVSPDVKKTPQSPPSSPSKKEKERQKQGVKSEFSPKEERIPTVMLLNTELPLKSWAETIGISVAELENRIQAGWSESEILYGKEKSVSAPISEPVIKKNPDKVKPNTQRDSKMDLEVCFEGEIKTLREWSVELNISQNVIRTRMSKGKKGRELLLPVKEIEARKTIRIGNKELSFRQWAERTGIPEDVIRSRYANGIRGNQLIFLDPKYKKKA